MISSERDRSGAQNQKYGFFVVAVTAATGVLLVKNRDQVSDWTRNVKKVSFTFKCVFSLKRTMSPIIDGDR
jgi:hypothetical protein